jgi:FixJ family two-component response regulator
VPSNPDVFVVVEDEAVRDAVTISLEMAGYRVVPFASARQFLDQPRSPGGRGCLLVDLELGESTDVDRIGALVAHAHLPAIVMSDRLRAPARHRPLPDGVVGLLEKPFGDAEMIGQIDQALTGCPHQEHPVRETP